MQLLFNILISADSYISKVEWLLTLMDILPLLMLLLVSRHYVYKIVECICMGGMYLCIRNSNKSHGTVKPTV